MNISSKVATSIALVVGVVCAVSLAWGVDAQANKQRREFRRTNLEALQLLALAIAPAVGAGRHDQVQAVVDNIANYPDRYPDIASIEVIDRERRVIAALDPRRFNVRRDDERIETDLRRRKPEVREVEEHLRMVVPIRLAHPLGVIRARISERRLDAALARRQRQAAIVAILLAVVLAAALYLALRQLVSRRIAALARAVVRLRKGQMDVRAPASGRDEIADLGSAFNEMAAEIQRYTGELESRVSERTSALEDANRRLSELASTDSLTGLFNRRHFEERAQRDVEVAKRADRPFSLVMVDIDRFKSINDRHGHPVGDVVLRDLAQLLTENARTSDLVARFGGEEFVIAMPDANAQQASQAAERVRRQLASADHTDAPELADTRVTASFGVACFPQHGRTLAELVNAADHALYEAKEQGRNRVAISGAREGPAANVGDPL